MIHRLLASLFFSLALLSGLGAADKKPSPLTANGAENLRNDVIEQIQAKMDKGAKSAADFAPELKKLDEHAAKYAEYPELVAEFALVKVALYLDGLNDQVQGRKMLVAIGRNYPGTPAAEQAAKALELLDRTMKRDAATADLVPLARQITAKADAGSHSEAAFAAELAKFDALIAKYADNQEAAADLALAKALLYLRVIKDPIKAREQLLAVTTKYPDTLGAASAQEELAGLAETAKH